MGSQTLVYPQRLLHGHIRLLRLLPGAPSTGLSCTLDCCPLESAPSFEALSYVWGPAIDRRALDCNVTRLKVTENLSFALKRLRFEDKERVLWVDALCINQEDLAERADQVKLMGEIYTRATQVVVWLGPDDARECTAGVDAVEQIYGVCSRWAAENGKDPLQLSRTPAVSGLSKVPLELILSLGLPSESWESLRKLFSRAYFTRIWCVQEIALSRTAEILLGDLEPISWEKLGVVSSFFEAHDTVSDFDLPEPLKDLGYYNCFCMFDSSDEDDELVDLLTRFRQFEATDRRDKVYGVLGLLGKSRGLPIDVDYANKQVGDVYQDVAMMLIQSREDLSVLSLVKHGQHMENSLDDGVLSWVPRWDRFTDEAMISSFTEHDSLLHSACGIYKTVEFKTPPSDSIAPVGVLFDRVISVSEVMDPTWFEYGSEKSMFFIDLWHEMSPSKQDDVPELMRLVPTLTGGLNEDYEIIANLRPEDALKFFDDFYYWMHELFQARNLEPKTYPPLFMVESVGEAGRYKVAASRTCDHRRFFRTSRGSFGVGPACMNPGDVVVVFKGGRVPFILREADEDKWYFLGEAFVYDIMHGEAFGGEQGEPDDNQSRLKAFNLT